MAEKYLIYNPHSGPVPYADGREIAPGELLYVEGDRILGHIESGALIQKPVPKVMPDDVRPEFYEALRAAFDDTREAERVEANRPDPDVRNTDTKNADQAQNKEA